jgi:acetyl-CoA decarbonylase/synthase complex subunit gamma
MPLILCSLDTNVIEAGLMEAKEDNPLIYAATTENWKEMGELSLMYRCPIVASCANIEDLRSIVNALMKMGVQDIILDPGTTLNVVSQTVNMFTQIRKSALRQDDLLCGHPIMGVPLVAWSKKERRETSKWNEACLASILLTRYADLLIMHSLDVWSLLPLVTLRQNLYTDPRKPVAVEPGLREFGTPDENSPVALTTNFSLTYFTVASDIESSRLDCYLLVADSEGLSVETAVAGRKLTAVKVSDILESSKIGDKVKHRKLIIPGRAARLSGEIEQVTGWEIMVGPEDSSALAGMIKKRWNASN